MRFQVVRFRVVRFRCEQVLVAQRGGLFVALAVLIVGIEVAVTLALPVGSRRRYGEVRRQAPVQKTGGLEFVHTRKITHCGKPEMLQKRIARAVGDGPSRHRAPSAHAHPTHIEQHIERALADRHAAQLLNLRPGHRLVVSDDRQGLDRRARQLARFGLFLLQKEAHIGRGPETPPPGNLHQIDAALGIERLQLRNDRVEIGIFGQPVRQFVRAHRIGRGEQDRFDHPDPVGFGQGRGDLAMGFSLFGFLGVLWRVLVRLVSLQVVIGLGLRRVISFRQIGFRQIVIRCVALPGVVRSRIAGQVHLVGVNGREACGFMVGFVFHGHLSLP